MLAVEARGLEKRFDETVAVDRIDLDIPVGGCFCALVFPMAINVMRRRLVT